ncbi:MAG: PAS domain S-box protein [Candidatus Thorarchaeota archaeon]
MTEEEQIDSKEALERERATYRLIADASVHAFDTYDLCQRILAGLLKILKFDFGTIRLYNKENNRLELFATEGVDSSRRKSIVSSSLDDARYIFSHIGRTQIPIFSQNAEKDESLERYRDRIEIMKIQSFIGWPLKDTEANLLGTLILAAREYKTITQIDKDFIQIAAITFGIAVQRKLALEELTKSEQTFRTIIHSMNDMIFVYDRNDYYSQYHVSDTSQLFKPTQDFLGKHVLEVLPSEIAERIIKANSLIRSTGKNQTFDYSLKFEGHVHWYSANFTLHEDKSSVVSVVRDITDRKQLEENLVSSERKHRALFEENRDAVFILTIDGRHLEANQRACDLLGYTEEELLKLSVKDTVIETEHDNVDSRLETLLAGEILPIYERTIKRKDGSQFPVEMNVALVRDVDGNPLHIQSLMRDISERKEVLETLQRSEIRYRTVVQSMQDIIFVQTPDDHYIHVYAADESLLLRPADKFPGLHISESATPEIIKVFLEAKEKLLETGQPQTYDYSLVLKGEEIWFTSIISMHEDGKNIVVVARPITEKKKAEDALRESEEILELALEGASLGFWHRNIPVEQFSLSNRWAEIFGYQLSEINPSTEWWISRIHVDDQKQVLECVDNYLLEKVPRFNIEYRAQKKDGEEIWVSEQGRIVEWDMDGKPLRAAGTIEDITIRKRAGLAIEESEKRLKKILFNIPEGIGITDLEERFVFCNQAFADSLGYTVEELENKTAIETTTPESVERILKGTQERMVGKPSAYIVEMFHKNGEKRSMRISATPMRDKKGEITGTLSVVVDVTDRIKAENELLESKMELELYTGILRHDLRNDLHVMLTQTEAAHMVIEEGTQAFEFCNIQTELAQRMANLLAIFDFPEMVEEGYIVKMIESRSVIATKTHKGLNINLQAGEKERSVRLSVGRLLPALFDNLFRNTATYAGKTPEIDIKITLDGGILQIDVSDNGPGISPDIRDRLFQRGVSTSQGGLGLYLGKQIVEGYGGTIHLLHEGSGATFRIRIPV